MNADDRGPVSGAKPPFTPEPQGAPVRREGLIPPSGSVPQRTAFRTVTGTHATTPGGVPSAGAPAGARPATVTPNTPTGTAPAGARPATPTGARPANASSAPVATSSATTATRPGAPETKEAGRSVAGSLGLGRLKDVAAGAATPREPKPTAPGAPRKVRVLLSRIDPWSALKIGFLISIAVGIMTMVAAHILWSTLNSMGTFDTINEWVAKLFPPDQEVNILQFFDYGKDMSAVLLVSVINVVLISGLSVIGAFIGNMISRVVGGVYVTLTDD